MVEPPEHKQLRRGATQKEHFVFRKSASPQRFYLLTRHNGAVGSVGDSLPGIKSSSRRAHAPKDNRRSTSRSHQIILGAGIFKTPVGPCGFRVHLIDYARATRPDWPRPAV